MLLIMVAKPRKPLLLLLLLRGRARKEEDEVEGAIGGSVSLVWGRPVPFGCPRVRGGCGGGRGGSE